MVITLQKPPGIELKTEQRKQLTFSICFRQKTMKNLNGFPVIFTLLFFSYKKFTRFELK